MNLTTSSRRMAEIKAVRVNGLALACFKKQTKSMCLTAVCQNGLALPFVLNQDFEICIGAVRQNGLALEHVLDQNREICMAAFLQNKQAVYFVRDKALKDELYRIIYDAMIRLKPKQKENSIYE